MKNWFHSIKCDKFFKTLNVTDSDEQNKILDFHSFVAGSRRHINENPPILLVFNRVSHCHDTMKVSKGHTINIFRFYKLYLYVCHVPVVIYYYTFQCSTV